MFTPARAGAGKGLCRVSQTRRDLRLTTAASKAFLEKTVFPKTVSKFRAFYGTGRFITVFTKARHMFLSSAKPTQPTLPPTPTYLSKIYFNITHLKTMQKIQVFWDVTLCPLVNTVRRFKESCSSGQPWTQQTSQAFKTWQVLTRQIFVKSTATNSDLSRTVL
jgi:hypothetical protein